MGLNPTNYGVVALPGTENLLQHFQDYLFSRVRTAFFGGVTAAETMKVQKQTRVVHE